MMNIFSEIKGVLLGQFTELTERNQYNDFLDIMKPICNLYNIPLVISKTIGHSNDSKGIAIGKYLSIKK